MGKDKRDLRLSMYYYEKNTRAKAHSCQAQIYNPSLKAGVNEINKCPGL
jgi:hypothetical protein